MNAVLGVSGSVAAYRAADLARELMRAGFTVRVCLTDGASRFVTPALFEALTGQPVLTGAFEEPAPGRMAHIDWARQADFVLVAPATANLIAKLASGQADDMLTTIVLATTKPVLVAPAMNPQMYANEATVSALETLRNRGFEVVEPLTGDVACGENGQGKLASIPEIVTAALEMISQGRLLEDRHVLVTSGPTVEPIDGVRYLSNRSSGKMGAAVARAALRMGARVTVVAGPQRAPLPLGANIVRVQTAEEMLAAGLSVESPDLIVGVAAVADYRPKEVFHGKLRRSEGGLSLDLVPNPDVLARLATHHSDALAIGFAAEPSSDLQVAREKLQRKGLWGIAANDISRVGIGFESDQNALALVTQGETQESGVQSKLGCALWLLGHVARALSQKTIEPFISTSAS